MHYERRKTGGWRSSRKITSTRQEGRRGTGSSNPPPSSGQPAANLAPSIRCRWPPLPSHFSLLSLSGAGTASAEAPIEAATMVTHYRKATIDGVSIFYREAWPADGPVFLLLHGFPTSSPTA
jgi:hypothetical protein